MTQDTIFSPFFATVFLTLLVWVYMYIRRISFITSRKLTPNELAIPGTLAQISPPSVSNPSDNLKNLFEIPVLFYALVLYLFITKQVDTVYVNAAWVFVVFRTLHSAVHCTFNLIILRFYLYLFATLAVWFIAIRAALIHFGTID
ncbi:MULTISPECIES: MAPEG family protein [unclassified Microcoleus]|uniref:MAPEG family protein n=1 Tax=unclassified Microcoleus TaxID=2642155 RepID=UPI002FD63438